MTILTRLGRVCLALALFCGSGTSLRAQSVIGAIQGAAPRCRGRRFSTSTATIRTRACSTDLKANNLFNADNIVSANNRCYNVSTTTNVLTPNASFGAPPATAGQRSCSSRYA
jgi:hypothetical protein